MMRMIDTTRLLGAASCAVLFVAGCDAVSSSNPTTAANGRPVRRQTATFYLPEMTERLKLMWADWPNRVKQALVGLEGVEVEDEWDRDPEAIDLENLLFVTYDAEKITIKELLELIATEGFEANVRPK